MMMRVASVAALLLGLRCLARTPFVTLGRRWSALNTTTPSVPDTNFDRG
jgi:hypothetical protein